MKRDIVYEIRLALQSNASEEVRKVSSRFFKPGEQAKVYGVRSQQTGKIARDFLKVVKGYSKEDVFEICEELWKSSYLEEAGIACVFSESLEKKYEPEDFLVFDRWVNKYVNNWADCDTLCNHTIGSFIMKYPEYVAELKRWARSTNRWTKRAAAVTLIIPARRGIFHKDIFDIADILLLDMDDLVQKGYGWMLKAASEFDQKAVFDYVMSKKDVMPRTALRYAIEKMPQELRTEAMKR